MNLLRVASVAALTCIPSLAAAQGALTGPTGESTKIAVIDMQRIALESAEGKALFSALQAENDKLQGETQAKQAEIQDMQAKLNSEILSQDAKVRLQRDIERKRTDAQRWLEDAQAEFETKRRDGEATLQEKMGPIVTQVAQENGIGLIFVNTPGVTIMLDPTLDISELIVQKLDGATAPPPGGGADAAAGTDAQGAENRK